MSTLNFTLGTLRVQDQKEIVGDDDRYFSSVSKFLYVFRGSRTSPDSLYITLLTSKNFLITKTSLH